MAGNVTGFQLTYKFVPSDTQPTVGVDQVVAYGTNPNEVVVPTADNEKAVGIVTYQYEDLAGMPVAVQLDRVAEAVAAEAIAYGDELIAAVGGKVKKSSGVSSGVVNVLGVAQNTVAEGGKVQVLIKPFSKKV